MTTRSRGPPRTRSSRWARPDRFAGQRLPRSSLVELGTAGLVDSVVPVDDTATVGFSLATHEAVAAGASLGEAVLRARERAGDDPVARATAWSFLALGAA